MKTKSLSEKELLSMLRILPEQKKEEVFDFVFFLFQKTGKQKGQKNVTSAVLTVEETWGNIPLRREILKDIAESKELEYDI